MDCIGGASALMKCIQDLVQPRSYFDILTISRSLSWYLLSWPPKHELPLVSNELKVVNEKDLNSSWKELPTSEKLLDSPFTE